MRPFLKNAVLGVVLVITSLWLNRVFPSDAPSLPAGFSTPIIAFEFVQTDDEVRRLFGVVGTDWDREFSERMDAGNRIDFFYMVLYSLFLSLFSITCANISGRKFFLAGAFLAILSLFADFMENVQLLGISAALPAGPFERELIRLYAYTWLKWGALAFTFLTLTPYFFRGGVFAKAIALSNITCCILGVFAFFHRSVFNELFALSVALVFVLMILYSFTCKTGDGLRFGRL